MNIEAEKIKLVKKLLDTNSEEILKEVKTILYGRQSESEEEREDWLKLGMRNFERIYAEDEPDISQITLKEPNPAYNPWK